jgi:hypothetical protein
LELKNVQGGYTTTFFFLRFNVSPKFLCNTSSCLLFLCDVISDVKDICYVFCVFTFDRLFDGLPCSFKFCPVLATLVVDGCFMEDNKFKAEALNKQFQSVFTDEDMSTLPQMGTGKTQDI